MITNKNYRNNGKMGDSDGPAYVVYSNIGYNKASMDVYLENVKINTKRIDNEMFVTAYAFLGIDIYKEDGEWINCCDSGLTYGHDGTWHVFYNVFSPFDDQNFWYESNIKLSGKNNYRLVLDSSFNDEEATLFVYDLKTNELLDSVTFRTKGSKKTGVNTNYLQNFALDFPENIKYGLTDWVKIVLKNMNANLYMNNLIIKNSKLNDLIWNEEKTCNRSIWPDNMITQIKDEIVKIEIKSYDSDFIVNFNMNK